MIKRSRFRFWPKIAESRARLSAARANSLSKGVGDTTVPAFDGGTRATCPQGEERWRDRARALAGLLGLGFKGAEASRALDTVLTR